MEKHFAVSGFVLNSEKTKLLMVFHKKLNTWVIPGGHLEPNEFPHEGALREIEEETGIQATIASCEKLDFSGNEKESQLPTPFAMLNEFIPAKGDKPAHIHMDIIFLCIAEEKLPNRREAEVNEAKWMTWDEVLECETFDSIKAFAKHMKGGEKQCKNLGLL